MQTRNKLPRRLLLTGESDRFTLDYISATGSARRLLGGHDWRSLDSYRSVAAKLRLADPTPHTEHHLKSLKRRIHRYLHDLEAPQESFQSLNRLCNGNALAVVTGQQPVLAGGPLMVLSKVAHTVKLAQELTAAGIESVPVFWAASEDHDLAEVNSFGGFDGQGNFKRAKLTQLTGVAKAAIEDVTFTPNDPGWDAIRTLCHGSDLSRSLPNVEQLISAAQTNGKFGAGISRMMLTLFGDQGLVVLEPRTLRGTYASGQVIEREIAAVRAVRQEVVASHQNVVDAGYRPQLPDPVAGDIELFSLAPMAGRNRVAVPKWFLPENRSTIEATMGWETWANKISNKPKLSSSVRLRPVMQCANLPVVAYVGGPSEIAYHAEIAGMFDWHGVQMPVMVPRWSVMVTEPAIDPESELSKIEGAEASARLASIALDDFVASAQAEITTLRKQMRTALPYVAKEIDQLEGRLERTRSELIGQMNSDPLKLMGFSKAELASAHWVKPGGKPQERAVSWLALWSRYGDALMRCYSGLSAFESDVIIVQQ